MSDQPQVIYLKDYKVPSYSIERTELRFELEEEQTLVRSQMEIKRNPECEELEPVLVLHGHESVELCRVSINGEMLSADDYQRDGETLVISKVPDEFEFECLTRILPQENTALEGLYKSDGMFCTQCEAEGFRRITFYPDRPDVMSVFRTTIEADKSRYPVLLSNGNPVASGDSEGGRHWVTWDDPFKKPAYLFALVAGDLEHIEDNYTTTSGRDVELKIYAEAKDLDKLQYAMDSLKNAMKWDEDVYGREYDLDIYMIVAVDFFNMGAMENKGLNIFNTSCVLANAKTTTDSSFQRVEGVVAHEYFHNWSGNRVTCRDWFQLSLKEGFTVFRDAEFSADMNSRTVKRIEDVTLLRTAQFAEDAGPMAHAVRPESFIEISNFYTLTVYEKGAEVVRMIHTLLGEELFRKGSDLYFERHDGQAVTTDDFVQAMEEVSGRDLDHFKNWYRQAGTPKLVVTDQYDAAAQQYTLTIEQSCPETPGQQKKLPFHIPVAVGLLAADGSDIPLADEHSTQILELTEQRQSFVFNQVAEKPVPSLLRGFSAPVRLDYPYSRDQLVFLMQNDSDGFNRWDASQKLAVDILQQLIDDIQHKRPLVLDDRLTTAFRTVLSDRELDPAMVAKVLALPSEAYLAELSEVIDVEAIHLARSFAKQSLAKALEPLLLEVYAANQLEGDYSPADADVAKRSLKNLCLGYLAVIPGSDHGSLIEQQFSSANNMTDQQAALSIAVHSELDEIGNQLADRFYEQWSEQTLVVNQWLSTLATDPKVGGLERVKQLMEHEAFDIRNPNKVRSLIAAFCGQNPVNFHQGDGAGYEFLADQIIALNELNPQIASRLVTPLTRWRKHMPARQTMMKAQLQRIMDCGDLSRDVYEVVSKSLI